MQVSNTHGRLGNARKPERQVTRMVVVMIVAFMVAWTPYAAFSIVVTAHPSIHLDPRLAAVPAFFSKTAAVYNPIIYVFMNKQVTFTFMHLIQSDFAFKVYMLSVHALPGNGTHDLGVASVMIEKCWRVTTLAETIS